MTAPLHYEYPVTTDTAVQAARAVVRYRLSSAPFLIPMVVLVALVVTFSVAQLVLFAVVIAIGAVLLAVSPLRRLPRLTASLRARGFRPGTIIGVDYTESSFVVTVDGGHATHAYADVRSVRLVGEMVAIKLQPANVLIVLPAPLLPDEARRRLVPGAH